MPGSRSWLWLWIVLGGSVIALLPPPVARQVKAGMGLAYGGGGAEDRMRVSSEGYRPPLQRIMVALSTFGSDPELQYAGRLILDRAAGGRDPERVRTLLRDFPDNKMLHAGLVLAEMQRLSLNRPDLDPTARYGGRRDEEGVSAQRLYTDAVAGERVDRGNALYPLARSYALLSLSRDDEARSALLEVGRADTWNSYLPEMRRGLRALLEYRVGPASTFEAMTQAWNVGSSLPRGALRSYYANMGAWCRQDQKSHPATRSLATRAALLRYAGLMRRDGRDSYAEVVGLELEGMAATGPSPGRMAEEEGFRADDLSSPEAAGLVERYRAAKRPDLADALDRSLEAARLTAAIRAEGLYREQSDGYGVLWIWALQMGGAAGLVVLGLLLVPLVPSHPRLLWLPAAGVMLVPLARLLMRVSLATEENAIGVRASVMAIAVASVLLPIGIAALVALAVRKWRGGEYRDRFRGVAAAFAAATAVAIVTAAWSAVVVAGRDQALFDELMKHEGRHYARVVGRAWPEAIMPPMR